MSSIDERVVQMKFDNTQFQSGVKTTTSALDALKKNLNLEGAAKGLESLSTASSKFSLAGMSQGIDSLVSKFSNLSIMGITALTNITNKAVDAGLTMAKSLTIDPIKSGFDEYELKMGSIQTILSNTARYGTKLPEVTRNLDALNTYADKTIYNFGDMTKNIGLFTNAGIKVGDATKMIKGFSNEAAASGTNAQGAASAAYQLSQALSAGKITLMDWRSLQNVGMGNKNMQKGLIDIAKAMGTFKGTGTSANKVQKDFNGSLEKGWLKADVMSKYLKIMAGDMSEAQMKSLGLSKTQIATFKTQQKNAEEAATKVRTLTQLIGTIRESVGSGWTDTWDTIVGDFNQATKLWTGVNDTLGGMIDKIGKARNDMLKSWAKQGGRDALIAGLGNAFKALMGILKPIKDAFRTIFPPMTGKQLADITKAFEAFTKNLIPGKDTMEKIKVTFQGVFSILKIGWDVIKGLVGYFMSFFNVVSGGSGGILSITASVGQLLVNLSKWIEEGDKIGKFFKTLSDAKTAVLQPMIDLFNNLGNAFRLLFVGNYSGAFEALKGAFNQLIPSVGLFKEKLSVVLDFLSKGIDTVKAFFGEKTSGAAQTFIHILETIQQKVQELRDKFSFKFDISGLDTSGIANATKSLGGLSKAGDIAKNVWDGVVKAFSNVQGALAPIFDKLGAFFGTLSDKITEYIKGLDMQDAVALLNTGFFIAMYAMMRKFIKQLSELTGQFTDVLDSIKGAFDGVGEMFGQLTDTLKSMQQSIQATTILKIAIAVGVLAGAMWVLSKIDAEGLKKALISITVLFGELMGVMYAFTKMNFGTEMAKAATMLVLLAIAVNILASAVTKLAALNWEELAKGLVGVGGLLAGLALFTKFAETDSGGMKAGAGLILLGIAVNILAAAVQKLGSMDTGSLIKGILALNVMISSLAFIVQVMNGTKGIPQAAAGLLLLSVALAALTVTMRIYAALDWLTLIKGLGTMAIALTVVGVALRSLPKNAPTLASGLLIAAAALIILAGALRIMGGMSVEDMAVALITLTYSLSAIAGALQAMQKSLPGAAALIVAAGALLILAGVMKILGGMDIQQIGLAMLAIAGVLAILAVAAAVMIPLAPGLELLASATMAMGLAMLAAGAGFALFAGGFAVLAAVGTAGVAVLVAAFTGILNLIPLFMEQIALGLRAFAKVISDSGPVIVSALTTLLLSLLQAIDNVIPKAVSTMVHFIVALLEAIRILVPRFIDVMGDIVMAMVNKVSSMVPRIADAGYRMIKNFLDAVAKRVPEIIESATNLIKKFLGALSKAIPDIVDAGFKMITDTLNGIEKAIRQNSQQMTDAGMGVADAIVDGMVNGIKQAVNRVVDAAKGLAQSALDAAKNLLGIHSPSREFYKLGQYVSIGFRKGIDGSKSQVQSAFTGLQKMLQDTMRSSKADVDSLEKKLYKLTHARKKDKKAIAETRAALRQANLEYARSTAAYKNLNKNWTDDKNKLGQLATKYDSYTQQIKDANQKLADAKKLRDDYSASIKDQYNDLPEITGETKLQDFANDIRKKIEENKKMLNKMTTLRNLGLNDTMYKEFIAKGIDAMPMIDELIASGKSGVSQINTLSNQLDSTAASLGNSAAKALYEAGVQSAQGLVDGLKKKQKDIEVQMDKIANAMVKSIKKSLGIKSPSREFMKVGKFSTEGLAKGLEQHSKMVEKSASSVGANAIDSMRKSITGLDKIVSDHISTDPVISPVLDLSGVRKDASKMGALFSGHGISVSTGYSGAKNASAGYQANADAQNVNQSTTQNVQDIRLIQNNYSPKALSAADSYRNTKSLISTAKGALAK